MTRDLVRLREIAAGRGCRLVEGKGRTVGERDYGKYGLVDAKTGHKRFGFGNRGVTATPAEIDRFLAGGERAQFDASLRSAKKRRRISVGGPPS